MKKKNNKGEEFQLLHMREACSSCDAKDCCEEMGDACVQPSGHGKTWKKIKGEPVCQKIN